MADWLSSMQQTFEYYMVDPYTWTDVKLIDCVKSCTINRDLQTETLGSATIDVTESVGECYIRVYLVTIQNGVKERFPLGTYLVQTPASSFDGRLHSYSLDAYTPLLELKENQPPIGYFIAKGETIADVAYRLTNERVRAPIVKVNSPDTTIHYDFVSDTNDTWLSYLSDFIANAKLSFGLDEMSRIIFAPEQKLASLQPVWTYNDDNSSILYPDLNLDRDIYGIPNVVEVIYSNGGIHCQARVINNDGNSPVSTVNRGREIVQRVINPEIQEITGDKEQDEERIQEYAKELLKSVSTLSYTVSYTHAYCPVRIGDCIRLNYSRAGLSNIKGQVISQSIKCEPGCPVTEKAIFTTKLWDGGDTV